MWFSVSALSLLKLFHRTTLLWNISQYNIKWVFLSIDSTHSEAECIFHEMLHKWNIPKMQKIPCPMCSRSFVKSSLRCHLRVHTNERIFKCADCALTFTRKSNLKEHFQRTHVSTKRQASQSSSLPSSNRQENSFICSICQKSFKKK